MSYDGSRKWEDFEAAMRRGAYTLSFSCATFDTPPHEVGYTGRKTGWEMRRKLKEYCQSKKIARYEIVRNTSYHADLHGPVYQLWVG